MDTRIAVLTILSFVIAAVVRAAKEDLPRLKTFSPASRAIFVASVSIVGAGVDGALANRVDFPQALLAAFMLGGPGLVMMIIEWLGGGNPPAGGASGGDAAPLRGQKGPYSAALSAFGLALALVALPGCPAFGKAIAPILDNAQTVIVDGQMILDTIQAAETVFFLSAPNPDLQTKVTRALGDARLALDSALRVTKGGKDLSDHDYDAAFDEFRSAYKSLVAVLHDAGVAAPAPPGKLAIHRGAEVAFLEPLALAPVLK